MKNGTALKNLRITLFAISLITANSCSFIPIKTKVPDGPVCRGLSTRPESKVVGDIGRVVVQRPNPTCMKHIGEPYCGYCFYTVSDKEVYVGNQWNHLLEIKGKKKTWDTIVEEGLTMPAETQADAKAFAINVCKATKACGTEIDRWRVKLDAADSIGKAAKP